MVLEAGFEPAAQARKSDLTQFLTQIADLFGRIDRFRSQGRRRDGLDGAGTGNVMAVQIRHGIVGMPNDPAQCMPWNASRVASRDETVAQRVEADAAVVVIRNTKVCQ